MPSKICNTLYYDNNVALEILQPHVIFATCFSPHPPLACFPIAFYLYPLLPVVDSLERVTQPCRITDARGCHPLGFLLFVLFLSFLALLSHFLL